MSHLSRRTVVKGATWAAPAVALGATVPAYASSPGQCAPDQTGSATYKGLTGSAHGRNIPLTNSTGTAVNNYTIYISSDSAFTQPINQSAVYNGTFAIKAYEGLNEIIKAFGTTRPLQDTRRASGTYNLDGATKGPHLVLNQARLESDKPSTQTVTFSFEKPVYSFSMPVYDLTYVNGGEGGNSYRSYQDQLNFSVPVTMTGGTANLNATSGTEFYRTALKPSTGTGTSDTDMVATFSSETPITSFTVTYTDRYRTVYGWQGIGFGPISTTCPPTQ